MPFLIFCEPALEPGVSALPITSHSNHLSVYPLALVCQAFSPNSPVFFTEIPGQVSLMGHKLTGNISCNLETFAYGKRWAKDRHLRLFSPYSQAIFFEYNKINICPSSMGMIK